MAVAKRAPGAQSNNNGFETDFGVTPSAVAWLCQSLALVKKQGQNLNDSNANSRYAKIHTPP